MVNLRNSKHEALCTKLNDAVLLGAACHRQKWIIAAYHFSSALSEKGDEQSHAYQSEDRAHPSPILSSPLKSELYFLTEAIYLLQTVTSLLNTHFCHLNFLYLKNKFMTTIKYCKK